MIILLNGLSRGGKDTVANHLEVRYSFVHSKIASHLKQCVSYMFDIPIECLEDDRKNKVIPEYDKTPRDILKFFGTDVGQYKLEELLPGTNRCFWVNRLIRDMKHMPPSTNFVVSDYRFTHERQAFQKAFPDHEIFVLKVIPKYEGFVMPEDHESERPLPSDFDIENYDINVMKENIDHLMINQLKYKRITV